MSSIAITDQSAPRDVDSVSRPVMALSATLAGKDWENATHQHRKAQLIYSVRGILNCEIEDGVWIVPPQCALWIPGHLPHSAWGSGKSSVTACSSSPMLRQIFQAAVARYRYRHFYGS